MGSIEGPVEGVAHAGGGGDAVGQEGAVQPAVGQKGAQHHPVRAQGAALLHLPQGRLLFRGGEAEIAEAGAQKHVHRNAYLPQHLAHQPQGGGGAADQKVGAQLQPVGAALLGRQGGFQRVHTDLQQMFHFALLVSWE